MSTSSSAAAAAVSSAAAVFCQWRRHSHRLICICISLISSHKINPNIAIGLSLLQSFMIVIPLLVHCITISIIISTLYDYLYHD